MAEPASGPLIQIKRRVWIDLTLLRGGGEIRWQEAIID
jgi:hypothetical protein